MYCNPVTLDRIENKSASQLAMARATDALDSVIVIPQYVAQIAVVTAAIDRSCHCHCRESERKEGQLQCTDGFLTHRHSQCRLRW